MNHASDDDLARTILERAGPMGPATAVSDALIAAWAEGRLDTERAALVEAHLAADDGARRAAFALRDEILAGAAGDRGHGVAASSPIPSLATTRARRATWAPFAAAAALLVALGVAFLGQGPSGPALDSDARLVAAAGALSREAPDLFADFRPVASAERREASADTTRSGLSILEPVGRVLETRPALRWLAAAGVTSYEIAIADADGVVVWRTTTRADRIATADAPTLVAGRAYVIEVTATGPLGRTSANRAFDVVATETAEAIGSARARAHASLGRDLGELAFAHAAARRGLLIASKGAVTAFLAGHPKDAAALEFDEYLRRRLGWPERPAGAGER